MKKLLLILLVLAGGYFAYHFLTTGEMSLVSDEPLTPAQEKLDELSEAFATAQSRYDQSQASAADTRAEITRIGDELKALRPQLTKETDTARVGKLLFEIEKFYKELL